MKICVFQLGVLLVLGVAGSRPASAQDHGHFDDIAGCIPPTRVDSWTLKAKRFRLGENQEGPELAEAELMGKQLLDEASLARMCLTRYRKQTLKAAGCDDQYIELFNAFEAAAREYAGRAVPYGRPSETYLTELQKAGVAYTNARDRMLLYRPGDHKVPPPSDASASRNAVYGPPKSGACP